MLLACVGIHRCSPNNNCPKGLYCLCLSHSELTTFEFVCACERPRAVRVCGGFVCSRASERGHVCVYECQSWECMSVCVCAGVLLSCACVCCCCLLCVCEGVLLLFVVCVWGCVVVRCVCEGVLLLLAACVGLLLFVVCVRVCCCCCSLRVRALRPFPATGSKASAILHSLTSAPGPAQSL